MPRRVSSLLVFMGLAMFAPARTAAAAAEADETDRTRVPDAAKEGVSAGLTLHRFQDDFGAGAVVVTPSLLHVLRLSVRGGVAWYPRDLDSDGSFRWKPLYYGAALVETGPPFLKGIGASVIRPYAFGGVLLVGVPSSLSDTSLAAGGIGGFGLEIKYTLADGDGHATYFVELGGIGCGARADKLPSHESLVSGFLAEAGVRFYL